MIRDHGSVVIHYRNDTIERAMTLPLGPIQSTIVQIILLGCVLQVEKTKHGKGRKPVTIGPYRRATEFNTYRWAVYIGDARYEFLSPVEAARFFIAHCNRTIAREAVKQYARSVR